MLDIKRLLRRKTTTSSASTTAATPTPPGTATDQTVPPPDDNQQHDPPPYTPSSSGRPQNRIPEQELLDPTLNFTAAQMEQQWLIKDKAFARAIVQFIAERFDGREKGWGGYKYTYICENENPPRKESAWDDILGYNAWSYRGRYRKVSSLAKKDFERRGFEVRKCEVYSSQDGIYVEWALDLRKYSK